MLFLGLNCNALWTFKHFPALLMDSFALVGPDSTATSIRKVFITQILQDNYIIQVNLDKTDSMGPGKLVRHMQNLSYTYDEYLICIGLGPSISSVICKDMS